MCCNTLRKHAGLIRNLYEVFSKNYVAFASLYSSAWYKFWPVRWLVELGLQSADKWCLTHIIVGRIL